MKQQKQIAILLVPLFILTVCWVIFNVYHNYVSSTITDPLSYEIIPIKGNFDTDTINKIKERKKVSPSNGILTTDGISPTPSLDEEEASSSADDEDGGR
jgi:hypothetical protein